MAKVETDTTTGWHRVISYTGDVTKVDLYHLPTGIHARGNAKRYHSDIYNPETGKQIAYYRALFRASQKLLHKTIKELSND